MQIRAPRAGLGKSASALFFRPHRYLSLYLQRIARFVNTLFS